jgi:hypothetical protein
MRQCGLPLGGRRKRALRVARAASRMVRAMGFPVVDFAYFLSIIREQIAPDVSGHPSKKCR